MAVGLGAVLVVGGSLALAAPAQAGEPDTTLNGDGAVTITSEGSVTLSWSDAQSCAEDGGKTCEYFTGEQLVVSPVSHPEEPSVPESEVDLPAAGSVTGGAVRMVTGADSSPTVTIQAGGSVANSESTGIMAGMLVIAILVAVGFAAVMTRHQFKR